VAACVVNFGLIGVLAMALPQILGNDRGPAQLAFDPGRGRLGVREPPVRQGSGCLRS
jgi:hypothetical protein